MIGIQQLLIRVFCMAHNFCKYANCLKYFSNRKLAKVLLCIFRDTICAIELVSFDFIKENRAHWASQIVHIWCLDTNKIGLVIVFTDVWNCLFFCTFCQETLQFCAMV